MGSRRKFCFRETGLRPTQAVIQIGVIKTGDSMIFVKRRSFPFHLGSMILIFQRFVLQGEGCKNNDASYTHPIASIRVKDLQHGVTVDLSEQTALNKGDVLYGRFTVPYKEEEEAVIVSATWSKDYRSTPVWMFLRKGRLPDGNSFDKSSVNYISRRSSVIQLSPASPGLYYLRIECLKPLSSLELTTMIGDLDYLRA